LRPRWRRKRESMDVAAVTISVIAILIVAVLALRA
jgi:hypothetical protein